jgi:hypothetical protein
MTEQGAFTHVAPGLEPVLEELRRLEPIFHTPDFGTTLEDFERRMAPEYFEVGASGRRYSRTFIMERLAKEVLDDAAAVGWTCSDFGLRQMGPETYQITYTLEQWQRVTRRTTIWKKADAGWQILYHQGTIVAGGKDDTIPTEEERAHPPEEFEHVRVQPAHVRIRGIGGGGWR